MAAVSKNKFNAIIDYFRKLATEHISIQHTPTSKHFFRLELDELIIGINSKARYPLLVLEGYKFRIEDNRSDNTIRPRVCAFMVLDKISDRANFDRIEQVYDECEEICDDIIARIKEDKRNSSSPFHNLNLNSIEGEMVSFETNGLCGIRITFEISSQISLVVDPSKWITNG